MAIASPLDNALTALGYLEAEGFVEEGVRQDSPARKGVWQELRAKTGVDAAYFSGAVPLVAFLRASDVDEIAPIQRRLWNLSRLPLLIGATSKQVGVYTCFRAPAKAETLQDVQLAVAEATDDFASTLRDFSRVEVESGRLGAQHADYFAPDGRVDRRLLANLRTLRAALSHGDKGEAVDALIGRSIFVRYLEDRGVLTANHFAELSPFRDYATVLEAGLQATLQLFTALATHFSGDIFASTERELLQLDEDDLHAISAFLTGTDVDTGQTSFWPYDFSVIPPELISSIYEQLLEGERHTHSAYYTPRSVVELILDEVLPWDGSGNASILDPACGSGIFLTEAFRRLCFRESAATTETPDYEAVTRLLTSSVFGIDLSATAIRVAAFGLYLALLERVEPERAWTDVTLPKLIGTNLIVADFFDDTLFSQRKFDVVLGNPPWQSRLPVPAAKYIEERELPVADKQIATAFLWKATTLIRAEGCLGFLLPAKPLLHNKSDRAQQVRRYMFEHLSIETVIDLSALRHGLFQEAVAPAAVIIARARSPLTSEESDVLHAAPRSTPLRAIIEGFVLSQEDIHSIPAQVAERYPDTWKVYLWGADQDFELISRLRQRHRALRAIADERGWIYGRGFQTEGGGRSPVGSMSDLPLIPAGAIHPFRIDAERVRRFSHDYLHRTRDRRLYEGPHVLIRRGLVGGRMAAALLEDDAVFNDSVIGFAAPEADAAQLKLLLAYVNSSLGHYFHFLTSSSWGVERDYVEANEHLSFPFALPSPRAMARIIKAVDATIEGPLAVPNDELNSAVFEAYDLEQDEVDLVTETLAIGLDQFRKGSRSKSFARLSAAQLSAYAGTLRRRLRQATSVDDVAVDVRSATTPYVMATVTFITGTNGAPTHASQTPHGADFVELLNMAQRDARSWQSQVTIVRPSALLFADNQVMIVKPNEAIHWTKSRARADAAEILGQVALQR